ncbi:TVP38/TMEM64 family protein [Planctobacterium marinum]|uniref:TVP38/TMEM64 family membrane protein n=1 Tax=Planctobacterium marinum TaxID=1631968 RepID=A0AA48HZ16_9ALTE|nr:hypothetical protein MACH26_39790 [Planctobacterium marinum]
MQMSNKAKIGLLFTVVPLILSIYYLTPFKELLTVEKVVTLTENIPTTWLTAVLFLVMFFFGGAMLLPIPLMALAVSLVFPVWTSVMIVIPGFILAATGGYLLGVILDRKVFGTSITRHIEKLHQQIKANETYAVFGLRIAPTPPFTVTSIVCGILRVRIKAYLLGSCLGIMPLGLSAVFFGRGALEMLKQPSGIAATSLLAAVVFAMLFVMVKRSKANNEQV